MEIGKVKVNTAKTVSAKKATMARKLLLEFFTPVELRTCTRVLPKPGKLKRSQADQQKLGLLLGMYNVPIYLLRKGVLSNFCSDLQKICSLSFPDSQNH